MKTPALDLPPSEVIHDAPASVGPPVRTDGGTYLEQTKNCTGCGLSKPTTCFCRRSASKDGLSPLCRTCAAEKKRLDHLNNLERDRNRSRQHYIVNAARIKQTRRERYASAPSIELEKQRAYRLRNIDREQARAKTWRQRNQDKLAAYRAKNRDAHRSRCRAWRMENSERCRAYHAGYNKINRAVRIRYNRKYRANKPLEQRAYQIKYYAANANEQRKKSREYYAANLEACRNKSRVWAKNNPTKVIAMNARRRARKHDAPGGTYTTAAHIAARWEMFGGRCWICGCPAEATDHMIALAKGGSHWPSNLRPICEHHNAVKHARSYKEFLVLRPAQTPLPLP